MRRYYLPGYILQFFLLFISVTTGCTNVKQTQTGHEPMVFADHGLFGKKPYLISKDEIFQLSDEQIRDFLRYYNKWDNRNVAAHRRIYNYLKEIVSNFNYQGNTYTAEEAIRLSSGNCLSLAIITTALAHLVNVDTGYQLVDDTPVYEQQGQVVFKGVHIRSILYYTETDRSESKHTVLGRSSLKVDYFPSGNERFIKYITENEYVAMYYRNKAAEAIAKGNYSTAYWLVKKSLEYAPDSADAINLMAVIHRQANDLLRAEKIYQYGIKYADDKLSLLKNYKILLYQQERYDEAQRISEQIDRYDDPSPFNMMRIAREAYNNGDYSTAIRYFRKATELAPYLHEGYFGLAISYYQLGDIRAAKTYMHSAAEHAFKMSKKSLYQAKLMMLSKK